MISFKVNKYQTNLLISFFKNYSNLNVLILLKEFLKDKYIYEPKEDMLRTEIKITQVKLIKNWNVKFFVGLWIKF